MRLDTKALALAFGLLWGGMLLLVSLAEMIDPGYGNEVLNLAGSVYPYYAGAGGFGAAIVVTLWGVIDGAIGGFVFGWLYNRFVGGGAE